MKAEVGSRRKGFITVTAQLSAYRYPNRNWQVRPWTFVLLIDSDIFDKDRAINLVD
jgi:hypothetical protein